MLMSGYIKVISADSKMFQRGSFSAPMGVCLCFSDPNYFDEVYDDIIGDLFEKNSLENYKKVYSSSNISFLFGKNRREYYDFIKDFVIELGKEQSININVVYTTLSTSELPDGIDIYGEGRSSIKNIPVPKFLRLLEQYYPYISSWIVTKRASFYGRLVYLDNIQGEYTKAWEELTTDQVVNIYPGGDLVCKEISAADICVRYVDDMLYLRHKSLRRDDIEEIFSEIDVDVITHYVGHEDLMNIKPINTRSVLSDKLFVSPMVYILKEQIMEKELEYLKARPKLMAKIEDYTYEKHGGLKFIDYTQDYKYIREEII
jgi:hypothetical protein